MASKRRASFSVVVKLQAVDTSKSMIDDNELDRILENTKLDEFEPLVIGSPWEQLDDLSQENMAVRSAYAMDSTSGPGPSNRSDAELCLGVGLARGFLCLTPHTHASNKCPVNNSLK